MLELLGRSGGDAVGRLASIGGEFGREWGGTSERLVGGAVGWWVVELVGARLVPVRMMSEPSRDGDSQS